MVRNIVHDPVFLAIPSVEADADDVTIAQDLLDTLTYHREGCVGMAANMIGVSKRIIAFDDNGSVNSCFLRASICDTNTRGNCQ